MHVPLINCDPSRRDDATISSEIDSALREVGFMALTNLGLSQSKIDDAFEASKRFFARSNEDKLRYEYGDASENFGYQALLEESLDPSRPADLKETFTMRDVAAASISKDRWPSDSFRLAATQLYDDAILASQRLQRFLAQALDVPSDFFVKHHNGENITLRFLHYPPVVETAVAAEQMGAGAHTDYGMLTLLFQDSVGGLQVRARDGNWHDVPPRSDAIVINSGDLLERWSNGRYRSTPHRVLPRAGSSDRYSIALFLDPDSDTEVTAISSCILAGDTPRYAPTTAGEHLLERIAATHKT